MLCSLQVALEIHLANGTLMSLWTGLTGILSESGILVIVHTPALSLTALLLSKRFMVMLPVALAR